MVYQLIACDLDETLLNDEHVICQKNIESIRRAREDYGIKFVPATGRGYYSVNEELSALDLINQSEEYVISNNGGTLTENKNSRLLQFKELEFDIMKQIFEFGMLHDVCIHVYTSDKFYVFRITDDEQKRLNNQHLEFTSVSKNTVDFLQHESLTKIVFHHRDLSFLMSLQPIMQDLTSGHCTVSYSSNRYMEFNSIGVDKGKGLSDLAKLLNIDLKNTIAIGDNYNDIAMLKIAGLSVAAGNAIQEVKAICDYTTNADNNEGVVAEVIEKFIK